MQLQHKRIERKSQMEKLTKKKKKNPLFEEGKKKI